MTAASTVKQGTRRRAAVALGRCVTALPATGFLLMGLVASWPHGAPAEVLALAWVVIVACCATTAYLAYFAAEQVAADRAWLAALGGLAGALALLFSGMAALLLVVDLV